MKCGYLFWFIFPFDLHTLHRKNGRDEQLISDKIAHSKQEEKIASQERR
jgi:hypothetical protein